MRPLKLIIGFLLLPACYAATCSVVQLIQAIRPDSYHDVPSAAWGLLVGFALWIVLYFSLPRPTRTYVLAHELTHALWAAVMGARVSSLKVTKSGGSVRLDKTNFLITLAPYFFPLYTVCAILLHVLLSAFFDLSTYEPFWLGLIGLTWGFHLTFTVTMLMQHQTDIEEHGRIFSYAVIFLFNVLGIGIWIVMVAEPSLESFLSQLRDENVSIWRQCHRWISMLIEMMGS